MNSCEKNLEYLRKKMVQEQLLRRDIKDKKVLDVFDKVPRHRFVDPDMQREAYKDFPLSIGKDQTISQPYMVALMVQLLDIAKSDKVLEVGTGSGYETAIIAELGSSVFSIERIEEQASNARLLLEKLGYKNIHIKKGDGTLGWEEFAPFEKIVVTAASPQVPEPLLDQLKEGGKLVIPIGPRFSQRLLVLEKSREGRISEKDICGCVFVPLIGQHGREEGNAGKDN